MKTVNNSSALKLSMILTAAILALTNIGCVSPPQPAFKRSGHQVFQVKCNGFARTIADCHAQASRTCNGEYDEMGQDGTSSFVPVGGRYMPVNNRSLLFTCKPPADEASNE